MRSFFGVILLGVSSLALAQDPTGYLYWSTIGGGTLNRSPLLDPSQEIFLENRQGTDIAYDGINEQVYWVALGADGGIWRSDEDGSNRLQLLAFSSGAADLELDVIGGKMYWIQEDDLQRANLDGSMVETLRSGLGNGLGMALDRDNGHIYYLISGEIRRMDMDGQNDVPIESGDGANTAIRLAFDEFNEQLYWAGFDSGFGLVRKDIVGGTNAVIVNDVEVFGVQSFAGTLYFVESNNEITQADFNGANQQVLLTTPENTLVRDFVVDTGGSQVFMNVDEGKAAVQTDLSGVVLNQYFASVGRNLHDVAVSADGSQVFFSDHTMLGSSGLSVTDPLGALVETLSLDTTPFAGIRGIALDPVANKVYFAELQSLTPGIRRINTDGSGLEDLVTGANAVKPHDIAIDVTGNRMYWTDGITSAGGANTNAAIRSAALDGSDVLDVLTGISSLIRGLDIDTDTGKIYFTDTVNNRIARVDSDGQNLETVVAANNPHDVAVDTITNTLYWTDSTGVGVSPDAAILCSDLDGNSVATFLPDQQLSTRDLSLLYVPGNADVIYQSGFEPVPSSPCPIIL